MTSDAANAVSSRAGAWHQSSIDTLLNGCSWQYALTNVLGQYNPPKPASEAGTAAHAAIEAHELERKQWWDSEGRAGSKTGIPLDAMQSIAKAHLDKVVPDIPERHYPVDKKTGDRMTPDQVYDLARNAVDAWYLADRKTGGTNREFLLGLRPVAIEPYFNVKLLDDTFPLGGWVDGVYAYGDGRLLIVDQKTAKDFSRYKDGEKRLQATLYSVAVVLSPEYPVTDLADVDFVYSINRTALGKTKSFERARLFQVVPDLNDVAQLGDMVRQAQQIHDTEAYLPNPGWGALCSATYCPFYQPCMGTGEWRIPFPQLKVLLKGDEDATK